MKRRNLLLSLSLLPLSNAFADENEVIELDTPIPNAQKTLIKIFSYDCPFCYRFDTGIDPAVKEALPSMGLTFKSMHLESRAKFGRVASLFFAYCMIVDKRLQIPSDAPDSFFSKAKESLYFAYLKKKERWEGGEKAFIKTLSEGSGIGVADFALARKNKAVIALADSWKVAQRIADIQGVPAYVVNGKYLIKTKAIRSKKDFIERIKRLAKR